MKRGKAHRPHQHPPYWRASETISSVPPAYERRQKRSASMGWNPHYEYTLGQNMGFFTGKVTREPRVAGTTAKEMVWFRLAVPNRDNMKQKLFIPVRCRGGLAVHVWENVAKGDDVAIVGQLWSARMFRPLKKGQPPQWRQFIFVDAERVSASYPVQLDHDPRYVKVRIDLWNRMCSLTPETRLDEIPDARRGELLKQWGDVANWYAGVQPEVERDEGDPDPSAERDPDERSDSVGDPGG